MHIINQLTLSDRSTIRDAVYRALREYASGGEHTKVQVDRVFQMAADYIADSGVIPRAPGTRYKGLRLSDNPALFPNFGVPEPVAMLIRHTLWELHILGLLAPSPYMATKGGTNVLPFYVGFDTISITSYGVDVLIDTANRIQVYDPDGYLEVFTSAQPAPDYEMMRYLSECVAVFRSNHLLATIVLLGSASERLIEVLAEHLQVALAAGGVGPEWYTKYSRERNITARFDILRKELEQRYVVNSLNLIYKRDLLTIELAFEAIRIARNDVAHQHNYVPTWNEVSGLMHNFTLYFRLSNRIISVLLANPIQVSS